MKKKLTILAGKMMALVAFDDFGPARMTDGYGNYGSNPPAVQNFGSFPKTGTFSDVVNWLLGLMGPLVLVLLSFAVVVFMWGMLKFVAKAGDAKYRSEGLKFIWFGIIGIVVIVSVWALVAFVTNTFGLPFGVPRFPTG